MHEEITVLLVDDHPLVRRGLRRILDDEIDIAVVGEAGDGADAVQLARRPQPKVVLMDWAMPGMDGLLATKKIVKSCPESAVLMLSMHSESTWVRQAVEAGARGYIMKSALELDLSAAIKRVAAGELLFDPPLPQGSAAKRARDCELTKRELEILKLIVDGNSNKEIAAELKLSENTIGAHRANIMATIGVHKTADLVVYAIRKRLVNVL
jgi:DNA-binding NarL/FixJ family response regulator